MGKFTVDFYREDDGSKPVGKFIRNLPLQMKAKVIGDLHLLEEYGNLAREPLSKHLEDGIFELRSKVGSDIVRILYFFEENRIIIATNGFGTKRNTNSTPPAPSLMRGSCIASLHKKTY